MSNSFTRTCEYLIVHLVIIDVFFFFLFSTFMTNSFTKSFGNLYYNFKLKLNFTIYFTVNGVEIPGLYS